MGADEQDLLFHGFSGLGFRNISIFFQAFIAFPCCRILSLRLRDNQTIASMTGISMRGPTTVETATIAKEGISRPAPADVPSSETPAAAEKKSSASDASVPTPKRKSNGIAWAASLAVIALAVISFFAIKAIQKPSLQRTPAKGAYSNAADATGSRAAQNDGAGTRESKPAPGMPSPPKPEEGKAASAKTGSSEAGGVLPGTAAPSKPQRSAAAHKSPKIESGILTWSGQLEKNAVLVLAPTKASVGSVTGELPGKPVSIEVEPKEVIIRQMPNEENGYRLLMLQSGANRFTSITIHWKTIQ